MQPKKDLIYHRRQQESPQLFKERISIGNEFSNVSPIQPLELRGIDTAIKNNKKEGLDYLQDQFMEVSPSDQNSLVQEFYKNNKGLMNENEQFYFENEEENESNNNCEYASARKQLYEYKKSMQDKLEKDIQQTDFDLTAKEINSNKRQLQTDKAKQVISERSSTSPMQSQTSRAETVKWAFSNKDSQETQKKVSVINRESGNPQELISRSLKTHDSKRSEMPQHQTIQSSNQGTIKGKMLDFENINSELESGILYHNNQSKKGLQKNFMQDSDLKKDDEELISFLEDDEDILMNQIRSSAKGKQSYFVFKGLKKQKQILSEALKDIADNTMDCPFCNSQKVFDESLQISKIEETKTRAQTIQENLDRKYLTSREYYNVKIINDIIYNESTHIVSVFKDYLIFDDISEFLKRFYSQNEAEQRLPKMFEFYEKFSKVFPNYVILPENKYMFKNIEKKQRVYDEKQRILQEQQEKGDRIKDGLGDSASKAKGKHKDRFSSQHLNSSFISQQSNNRMFNSSFINSVANIEPSGIIDSMMSSRIYNSQFIDHQQNSSILIQKHLQENMDNAKKKKNQKRGIEDLNLDELISKFIAKDSESNIQQSTIITEVEEKEKNISEKKQKNVYEYQVKPQNQQQQIIDKSKQTDTSGRPTSSKQKSDSKRLSSGTARSIPKQEDPKKGTMSQQEQQAAALREAKMVNYNIYNNYNQYINNENYYISTEDAKSQNFAPTQKDTSTTNKQGSGSSLSRTQSKPNLLVKSGEKDKKQEQMHTPSKQATHQKEVVTPNSGGVDKRRQVQNKNRKNFVKQEQEYFVQGAADDQLQRQQTQNKSSTSVYKSQQDTNASPIQVIQKTKINTNAFPSGLNTLGTSVAGITSRDQSKDRQPKQIVQNIKQQQQSHIHAGAQGNSMFKKDLIQVVNKKLTKDSSQKLFNIENQDYNIVQAQKAQDMSSNVRSVERLKQIEEEIEKDYSKYVNEYGLTKTAFAKAVNSLREKQVQQQQQQYEQHPLTERAGKTTQGSNEKGKKFLVSNLRSGSASQSRKQSSSRQQLKVLPNQESVNDLYMNTNTLRQDSQRPIRSVRAKTILSSQNSSSCFQKSQKLSPDKNYLISNSNQGNYMAFNQSTIPFTSNSQASNYITLKAQPGKNSKGIKIKFPLNSQRGNTQNGNNSNTQTPKRIKLQKTKSTSNIPITYRAQSSQASSNMPTQRSKVSDMMILDEMSHYLNNGAFMPNSSIPRSIQNQQFGGGSQVLSQLNDFNNTDNQLNHQGLNPQQTFQSSSCGGTYVTTSILNSPLSFKNQPVVQKNTSKNRGSSRNNNSQHQSQKSTGGHQRASSTINSALQGSNGKNKQKESKRMSAGSNLSKKVSQPLSNHQPSSSNVQQQLIQLLMSYQNQQESDSNIIPLSQTVRNLQASSGLNSGSMKDLKSIKQATTNLLKDIQLIKPKNPKQTNQGALIQQTSNNLQTQRLVGSQSSAILMQQNIRKGSSKSGKNTARGDSKKRKSVHTLGNNQINEAPTTLSTINQYSNMQPSIANHELSSRIASALSMGDSTMNGQDSKRILNYSKSTENFDLIKMAAQRAAQEQQHNFQSTQQQASQPKFLQNLKHQDNNQFLISKLRLINNNPQQQQQPIQSARNLQFDATQQQNYQFRGSEYEHYSQSTKGPSSIVLQSQNIDKSQSRRASGKFQPSTGKI